MNITTFVPFTSVVLVSLYGAKMWSTKQVDLILPVFVLRSVSFCLSKELSFILSVCSFHKGRILGAS